MRKEIKFNTVIMKANPKEVVGGGLKPGKLEGLAHPPSISYQGLGLSRGFLVVFSRNI